MSHSYYLDNKNSTFGPYVEQQDNHMIMKNVIKPVKEAILTVDSQYLIDSVVKFGEKISEVKSLEVESVDIIHNFYNILAGCNTFTITQSDTEDNIHTITLEPGFYTEQSIVSEINTQLLNIGIGYNYNSVDISFSINPITHKSYFTSGGNQYTINFTDSNNLNVCTNLCHNSLGKILGYNNLIYTFNNTAISERVINLKNLRTIYLAVNEYSNDNVNSYFVPSPVGNANKNIIAKISIPDINFGSTFVATCSNGLLVSDKRNYINKINIQRMHLTLLDSYGVELNNSNMVVTFNVRKE